MLDGRLVDGHGVEHPVPVALGLLVTVPHRAHPLALDSLLRPGVLGRGLNGDFKNCLLRVSAANSQEISIYFNKYLFGQNKYFLAYFWEENKYILA